jgi:hypothetical protein
MLEVRLDTNPATLETMYVVRIDKTPFCYTQNDEVGFNLLVAVNELEYRRHGSYSFGLYHHRDSGLQRD